MSTAPAPACPTAGSRCPHRSRRTEAQAVLRCEGCFGAPAFGPMAAWCEPPRPAAERASDGAGLGGPRTRRARASRTSVRCRPEAKGAPEVGRAAPAPQPGGPHSLPRSPPPRPAGAAGKAYRAPACRPGMRTPAKIAGPASGRRLDPICRPLFSGFPGSSGGPNPMRASRLLGAMASDTAPLPPPPGLAPMGATNPLARRPAGFEIPGLRIRIQPRPT